MGLAKLFFAAGCWRLLAAAGSGPLCWPSPLDRGGEPADLPGARGDALVDLRPALLALAQHEEVLITVVAVQRLEHLRLGRAAAVVAQPGAFGRIARSPARMAQMMRWALSPSTSLKTCWRCTVHLPAPSGAALRAACGRLSRSARFGQNLLPEWPLARAFRDHLGPVAHPIAQRHDVLGRAEGLAQKASGVKLLEPLRILHVGLLAGHAFEVPGVDQRGGGGE